MEDPQVGSCCVEVVNMMKKIILGVGILMGVLLPTKAKANFGYAMPTMYRAPSYGYAQPAGFNLNVGVSVRYNPSYGLGTCGVSYGGCNSFGGYAMPIGSHGMAGYGYGGGFGYGFGGGYGYGGGFRAMGCGSRHHGHGRHRCGYSRRCCSRGRGFRSFSLNLGFGGPFGGFGLGIQSVRAW